MRGYHRRHARGDASRPTSSSAASGASTLGELPAAGAAAILVPGEYEGWSQAPNAEYLQAQGAAIMLAQPMDLGDLVTALLDDERAARGDARRITRARAAATRRATSREMLIEAAA